MLKTNKDISSSKLQNFTDVCMVGQKLSPTIQTVVNFRNFVELNKSLLTYYDKSLSNFTIVTHFKALFPEVSTDFP